MNTFCTIRDYKAHIKTWQERNRRREPHPPQSGPAVGITEWTEWDLFVLGHRRKLHFGGLKGKTHYLWRKLISEQEHLPNGSGNARTPPTPRDQKCWWASLLTFPLHISSVNRSSVSTIVFVPLPIRMKERIENVIMYMPPLPIFW